MIYIKRDEDGKICAVAQKQKEGYERTDATLPEVKDFVNLKEREKELALLQSDLGLIRVLEDLIDVLMKKNIITITDFPEPVIKKLLERRDIRNRVKGSLGMEFYDDESE